MNALLIILVTGLTQPILSVLENPVGCWQVTTKQYGNVITFCLNRDVATATVYYRNEGNNPTFCRQFGYSEIGKSKSDIKLEFLEGDCDNGKKLDADKLGCRIDKLNNLVCKRHTGYTLELSPVNN